MENFGISFTLFYTFIPLWVGSLLIALVLKMSVSKRIRHELEQEALDWKWAHTRAHTRKRRNASNDGFWHQTIRTMDFGQKTEVEHGEDANTDHSDSWRDHMHTLSSDSNGDNRTQVTLADYVNKQPFYRRNSYHRA